VKTFRILFLASISYFIVACGTAPTNKTASNPKIITPVDTEVESIEDTRMAEIESNYLSNNNINEQNWALLSLADAFKNETNCNSTEIIVKHILASSQNQSEQAYANLLKAECVLSSLNDVSNLTNKQPLLDLINLWLEQAKQTPISSIGANRIQPSEFAARTEIIYAKLLAEKGQFFEALQTFLGAENAIKHVPQPLYSNIIWKWFSRIEHDERVALSNSQAVLKDYNTLLDTIEDSTINDSVRIANIKQWLLENKTSEVANNLPLQIQKYLAISTQQNQNVAVLLPLSGRLSGQGKAIQQGILSAYYNKLALPTKQYSEQANIEFIDTGSLPKLNESISTESLLNYDTIIGPLLRTHIEQINDFNLSGKQQLLLNQSGNLIPGAESVIASFSLSPEQEAEQLVALMRKNNINNPVLINDGTSVTKRMNNAFVNAWAASELTYTDARSLQQIQYTDNKSMRVGITSALDVLQSKKRIQQLSNISQERVYSVTRNRRDIDAFVVFARPNDVELINPIIETSISLFTSEQIPVFATSYSYDHKQSKNSQRDLRNLVFVDMPWLLPSGRENALSSKVDTLFNRPPSAFLRLFAFGYDSLALIDNLAQLSIFAHMSVNGLSGVLSIDQNQTLVRELSSLSITKNNLDN
jgi:outer membrane PBP1 activator LpoA protein